ncbi:MmgE/PrpD family protein [Streptomyces sioyaensis]|uniref:MmgE/PrpD family protein n=1 Tax=Streptomyces sioyaensis TaxID=67364 RepID=UPI0037AA3E2B
MTGTTTSKTNSAPGPTEHLASWVETLTWDAIPAHVQDRATDLLLDGIACALVGAQLPWSRIATDSVLALEGAGDCPVIGTGRTTSAPAAAILNSTFIQGFELDDFHPLAPLHSASLVVPALFSTASLLGRPVSGRDLLTAAVAGFETGPRVGHALHGTEMLSRGWHSGAVFGTLPAAMAAGKLRALPADRLEDALGFAATQSAGLMSAQYEAMGKRMQHGFAARNGFYAAGLAAGGYTGIKRVFEREYGGFLAVYGEGHDPRPDRITKGLGQDWETTFIMVKSHAVMGGLHGAVQAAQALRERVDPARIERIDLRVGNVVHHHGWWRPERPLTAIGGQMNIGYATAVALLDGTALPEQFTEDRLDADDVWALVDRTHVTLDPKIDALPLMERFSTYLDITLRDGSVLCEAVISPHGNPFDPLTRDEVVDKYRALTARVLDLDRQDAIEKTVLALADAEDIRPLIDLLAPAVGRVLD